MRSYIQFIAENSRKVYDVLLRCTRCSFGELLQRCQLAGPELGMALVQLLRDNKIEQEYAAQGVYYRLAVVAS